MTPDPNARHLTYEAAFARALAAVRDQDPRTLAALGAEPCGESVHRLPVLNETFLVDLSLGRVDRSGGVRRSGDPLVWPILALHYLSAASVPGAPARWIGFADIADARGYESVYLPRVGGRLCAGRGRGREGFLRWVRDLGGKPVPGGDEGASFRVFPLLEVRVLWRAGDDEFPPSVTFLYPDLIRRFLSVEDIVVMAEGLVGWTPPVG